VLLIVLAVIDWFVTATLRSVAAVVREPALQERADVSVLLSLAATIVAILAAFYLFEARFPFSGVLLIASLAALSAPQLIWYVSFRRGRFR
jgi:hypothetical protein